MRDPVNIEEILADSLNNRVGWNAEDHPRNSRDVPRCQQEQNNRQRVNLETASNNVRVDDVPVNLLNN